MRWPFSNWRRGAAGGDDPPPREHANGAIAPAPATASPDAGPGPAAWRGLPPIQRAVTSTPLTAPSLEFARDLAGRRLPDPMISPLGHAITTGGPAGLVSGIATPLVQRATGDGGTRRAGALPAPAPHDHSRAATRRPTTSVALPRPGTTPAADPNDSSEANALPVDEPVRPPAAADAPLIPTRSLAVIEPTAGIPAIGATRVAEETAPAPVLSVARTVASASVAASVDAAGPPRVAADVTGVEGIPSPAARSISPDHRSVGQPGDAPGGLEQPIVARRTLGESRRLGLGAPLAGPPPAIGRAGERSDLPLARLARPASPGPSIAPEPSVRAVPAARAASMPLPRLVVARVSASAPGTSIDGSPEATVASAAPPDGPGPVADEVTPDRSFGEADGAADDSSIDRSRPLTGDTPIGVSRRAIGEPTAAGDIGVAPGMHAEALPLAPGPAIVWARDAIDAGSRFGAGAPRGVDAEDDGVLPPAGRATEAGSSSGQSGAASGPSGDATPSFASPSFTSGPALVTAPLITGRAMRASLAGAPAVLGLGSAGGPGPVVARLASASSGATRAGADPVRTSSIGADRPLVPTARGAAVQRDTGPGLDRSSGGPTLALAPGARTAPVGGGAFAGSTPALPLMRSSAGTVGHVAHMTGESDGAGWTAGAGFTTVAAAPGPFVQREVQINELDVTPSGGAAGGAGAAGAAHGATAPAAGGAGTDYEELAEQLFDKIRARLTSELLLDRERAGMLVDG